ncbi:thiamine pyrophosphate-binding protein [Amycolatopsis sp. NPDC005232]|uniref:thiamine pyrophosphate-binding protein n=1 Tax=Amycolatopsis sp. NPDC005232 TaxID=3157027 RepID=UPI0033BF8712
MVDRHGGDLLIELMCEYDVRVAFGVASVHNLPLVEALDREGMFVAVRHEAAAVNAADAYSRVSGGLGVAITSTGTGAGNAAGSMVEAQAAGSRVLHITGQIESAYLNQDRGMLHDTPRQTDLLRAVSKSAKTVLSAEGARRVLWAAAAEALAAPQGPVSVEWPYDLQYAAQTAETPMHRALAQPPVASDAALDEAAELVLAARRPVLWIGGGGRGARAELLELAELLGLPVLTSNAGRGSIREDHEQVIGNYATYPDARELLAAADLLIGVGTHYRASETANFALAMPGKHVQIDVDPLALGRNYPATVGLAGDAAVTVEGLLKRLRGWETAREPDWTARGTSTRHAVRKDQRSAIGQYAQLCDSLRLHLPEDSVIARDVTVPSSTWGNRLLEIYDPATNVYPLGGGIGQGLAMGIGAAAAQRDQPTAVIAGDGGVSVHIGEIATLAEQSPWLILIVFNDGGYGVLRSMQDVHGKRRAGVDLLAFDFARLAASVGLEHRLVRAADDFDDALSEALSARRPFVVEVDMTALAPMPKPFVPPLPVF